MNVRFTRKVRGEAPHGVVDEVFNTLGLGQNKAVVLGLIKFELARPSLG